MIGIWLIFVFLRVRKARKAGQWAYDNNWNVPEPPPTPDIQVAPNVEGNIEIKWDDGAETAADFAGYKVYRSTPFPKVDSQELGIRIADRYHEQTTPNMSNAELAALGIPNNPNISSDSYRPQEPNAWGPYHLIANISAGELSQRTNPDRTTDGYEYVFEDDSDLVSFGFTYWYYVAAYDDEGGEIAGKPFSSLESHRVNFNGKSGLWEGTYHYATASAFFPDQNDTEAIKDIGAPFILKSSLVSPADLQAGVTKIRVTPNPYKVEALHDTGQEHKILFSNLPTGAKITILDVSGQTIDVLRFEGTNPADGTIFWDMFSKDGIEVTSGLYIYVAEYPGGSQTGHFAILR
ncbi:MAG TPA: T9SS type A sorting domain-containing protein [Candidatus Handelsmanbacteria bacterium]|nr:T9SS type A sorting domain-containing protein [Candidatus Handelsmanbacteria bacterium]